jgi:hypothetical protein
MAAELAVLKRMVLFDLRTVPLPDALQLFCQVTGLVNAPEPRDARRRSVRLSVQGWPGPSATCRIPDRPHHTE